MSFAGAFPANAPKYVYPAIHRLIAAIDAGLGAELLLLKGTVVYDVSAGVDASLIRSPTLDSAAGAEYSLLGLRPLDSGLGVEYSLLGLKGADLGRGAEYDLVGLRSADACLGVEYSLLGLKGADLGRGAEYGLLGLKGIELGLGAEYSLARLKDLDSGLGAEYGLVRLKDIELGLGADITLLKGIAAYDLARGSDVTLKYIMRLLDLAKGADAVLNRLLGLYDRGLGADYGLASLHLDVAAALRGFNVCQVAVSRMVGDIDYGKEVRAEHYATVPQCAANLLSAVSRLLQVLKLRGASVPADIQGRLNECWSIATGYPTMRSGDLISPAHENKLIDLLVCLSSFSSAFRDLLASSGSDGGGGVEYTRLLDLTPVADRVTGVSAPIPYYTDRLSPPGSYVMVRPQTTYTTAYVSGLPTAQLGLTLYVRNISQGSIVWWNGSGAGAPCAVVYVYGDGWVLTWFNDRCSGSYTSVAIGVRTEVLSGAPYLHVVGFDQDHADTDQPCINVKGFMFCGNSVDAYSGPVRLIWEAWVPLS